MAYEMKHKWYELEDQKELERIALLEEVHISDLSKETLAILVQEGYVYRKGGRVYLTDSGKKHSSPTAEYYSRWPEMYPKGDPKKVPGLMDLVQTCKHCGYRQVIQRGKDPSIMLALVKRYDQTTGHARPCKGCRRVVEGIDHTHQALTREETVEQGVDHSEWKW
jgi:hypothetical protein